MTVGGIIDNIQSSHRQEKLSQAIIVSENFHSIFPELGCCSTTGMRLSDHLATIGPSLPLVLATTGATISGQSTELL